MDRMLGFASLLLMALAGLGLARQLAAQTAVLLGIAVTAALCVLTILLVFDTRTAAAASGVIRRVPSDTARRMGISLLESVRKYAAHPGTLVTVLIGSVGVQVLRVLQAFFLGRSLDIAAPLAIYFAFLPLILIVMLVPVTINGIGTSQAAFVWFFSQAQVPEAASFALSVLFVALGLVGNLPGALLYVTGKRGD
jgi:hypothetical protein